MCFFTHLIFSLSDLTIRCFDFLKDGPLKIKATTTGPSSTIAKIVRMVRTHAHNYLFYFSKREFSCNYIHTVSEQVEDAQAREAPVQRLADSIAGPFVYTVMTLSAATFTFWSGPLLLLFSFSKKSIDIAGAI